MAAGVFRAEVGVDDVSVAEVVEVGAEEVHIAFFNQFFSRALFLFGVASRKREHIYLKQCAGAVEGVVALGMLAEIVVETLGMRENRTVALDFKVEKKLVEVPRFLNERVFDKDIVVGKGCNLSAASCSRKKSSMRFSDARLTGTSTPQAFRASCNSSSAGQVSREYSRK